MEAACRVAVESLGKRFGPRLQAVALFGSAARDPEGGWNDLDFYAIIDGAEDRDTVERDAYAILWPVVPEPVNVLCRAPAGFDRDVTPLMLDLAVDARVLCDPGEWLRGRLGRLRAILVEAGLRREDLGGGNFRWAFARPPRGEWSVTWSGFRDEAA